MISVKFSYIIQFTTLLYMLLSIILLRNMYLPLYACLERSWEGSAWWAGTLHMTMNHNSATKSNPTYQLFYWQLVADFTGPAGQFQLPASWQNKQSTNVSCKGLPWWQSGLRGCHWLFTFFHLCWGMHPYQGMWESYQWLGLSSGFCRVLQFPPPLTTG